MLIFDYILIGFGLAMDAFAVSICKGLSFSKLNFKKAFIVATYFSLFQMLMPIIGYFLGIRFSSVLESVDHWISFLLLSFIGIKMILDSFKKDVDNENDMIDFKTMVVLAVATSIDALAIGLTFAFLNINNICFPIVIIGLITFALSTVGVILGNKFSNKLENKSKILGGSVLVFIGIKILIDHLF